MYKKSLAGDFRQISLCPQFMQNDKLFVLSQLKITKYNNILCLNFFIGFNHSFF